MSKLDYGRVIPFVEHLGIRVVAMEPGRVMVEQDLKPEHLNSWGSAHGGVVMTLLDVATSLAMRTTGDDVTGAITVELKTNFLNPGKGQLQAEGRVVHGGKSLSVCEGEVRDSAGALVAKAMGTFKAIRRKSES